MFLDRFFGFSLLAGFCVPARGTIKPSVCLFRLSFVGMGFLPLIPVSGIQLQFACLQSHVFAFLTTFLFFVETTVLLLVQTIWRFSYAIHLSLVVPSASLVSVNLI